MSINLGIIGAGAIGTMHTNTLKGMGIDVVGLADIDPKPLKKLADANNIKFTTTDPQKLIDSNDIDAVVVCVPNNMHKPLTIAALEAGKDVLVEKPMAMSATECTEMIEAAKKNNRILQVGFVSRYATASTAAKKFIEAGRVGKIYHTKANYYRRRGIPGLGGWFTDKSQSGGGPLIDLGVHVIDQVLYLMDFPKPTRVSGKVYSNFGSPMKNYTYESMWAGPPNFDGVFDVEDSVNALIRFDNDATLELNATWAGNFVEEKMTNMIGIFGDKAGLTFSLAGSDLMIATEEEGHNVDLIPKIKPTKGWELQHKYFADAVKNRTTPIATGEHGRMVQAIIDAIYESSKKNMEVKVKL